MPPGPTSPKRPSGAQRAQPITAEEEPPEATTTSVCPQGVCGGVTSHGPCTSAHAQLCSSSSRPESKYQWVGWLCPGLHGEEARPGPPQSVRTTSSRRSSPRPLSPRPRCTGTSRRQPPVLSSAPLALLPGPAGGDDDRHVRVQAAGHTVLHQGLCQRHACHPQVQDF